MGEVFEEQSFLGGQFDEEQRARGSGSPRFEESEGCCCGVVTNVFPTAYADVSKVWDHISLPVKVLSRIDGRDIPFPIIPTNV
jgi:hypothetical protein